MQGNQAKGKRSAMDDLISRRTAIEMLCAMRCSCKPEECGLTLEQDGAEECADVRWIMSLPSAQSEQSIKIQDILEYLDTVLHPIIAPDHWSVYSELHDMVSMLSSAQPERWIPVSERLPGEFVSVQAHMTDAEPFPSVREAYLSGGEWFFPALNEYHPVDKWAEFLESPEEECYVQERVR